MPIPPHFEEVVHKALASDIRKNLLISLGKGRKYLSQLAEDLKRPPQSIDFHLRLLEEIGMVSSEQEGGKKYYTLTDRRVLEFLKEGKPLPLSLHPRPPHELILEELAKMKEQLARIESKLK